MNLVTLEDQIKAEYGAVSAWVALHPKLAITIAVVAIIVAAYLGHKV